MKKALMLILITTITLMLFSGCGTNTESTTSNGKEMTTRQYEFNGFNKIVVNSAFEIEIMQGDAYSINITADEFSGIKVEKDGDTLQVSRHGTKWFVPAHQKPIVCITLPNLDAISLSGATQGTVSRFQSNKELTLRVYEASHLAMADISVAGLVVKVSGASEMKGSLEVTGSADLAVSGASKVELTGTAKDVSTRVSGASRCNLISFSVCDADMEVSGASNGWVNLNGRHANVSGASNLTWLGNPTMGDRSTFGGSYICGN